MDSHDIDSMMLCAWKEARGDGQIGVRAVMHVIMNRARREHGDIHKVVYAKNQFTSMSVVSDPEYDLKPPPGDREYQHCSDIALDVIEGRDADPTLGALYYCNPKTATSGWFLRNIIRNPTEHRKTITIKHHDFYL